MCALARYVVSCITGRSEATTKQVTPTQADRKKLGLAGNLSDRDMLYTETHGGKDTDTDTGQVQTQTHTQCICRYKYKPRYRYTRACRYMKREFVGCGGEERREGREEGSDGRWERGRVHSHTHTHIYIYIYIHKIEIKDGD